MATQTGGGAPAPARIYRWESLVTVRDDGQPDEGMLLRTDDDRRRDEAYMAQYWHTQRGAWRWMTKGLALEGRELDEDAARRACLLAVLHDDDDEPRGAGR